MSKDNSNHDGAIIEIQSESLPALFRIVRRDGQSKLYEMKPAAKGKLGASLQGVDPSIERYINRR